MVGVARKVTFSPGQIVFADPAILTAVFKIGLTSIVIIFDVTVGVCVHVALEVIMHFTLSLFNRDVGLNVALVFGCRLSLIYHL